MNEQLHHDLLHLEAILEKAKEQGFSFLNQLDTRPTSTANTVVSAPNLGENGIGALEALRQFHDRFDPIIVGSTGPRYWGFVTGGATPASIVGDWLSSIYDQNTQSLKGYGDISANIEMETISLLLDLFELPNTFLGGFVTGATMSNFSCLAVARQWLGNVLGKDIAKDGVDIKIPVLSAMPHSSAVKSLAMLGMGSKNITIIKTMEGNREAMDMLDLEHQIQALEGQPFILISSAGTVNTTDFDDFVAIQHLKTKYQFWWHIDAAFGGFAVCSPEHKHQVQGWEGADSITIDCHKWLNVPYDSAFYLIKEQHKMQQVATFQNSNAPYLGDPLEQFSYLNFLPENSRRLRALPVWFTLRAYGKSGYRDIVENSIAMAQLFGQFVEQSADFELLAPVRLNNVCFTLKGLEKQELVSDFLGKLNTAGRVFMTPTVYKGKKGIRAAFVNWRTTKEDVQIAIEEMKRLV